MPPSTGAPLRTTRGAKPLFDFHYFLWKEKFISGADSRSTLFIPPDIDIPSPLLLLPRILRIFLFAGHDASVNLKWPPSDPFHSLEWKLNEIGLPRIEAGDRRCLSLSRIHPFVKMNEFSLPNVYRTLYNKQRNFLFLREIIKIYESSSFFSFFVRTWIFSKDPISTRHCSIFNKIRYEKSRVKESHESTVNRELNSSSDTINFPLDKRLRFGRSSSPRHLNSAG